MNNIQKLKYYFSIFTLPPHYTSFTHPLLDLYFAQRYHFSLDFRWKHFLRQRARVSKTGCNSKKKKSTHTLAGLKPSRQHDTWEVTSIPQSMQSGAVQAGISATGMICLSLAFTTFKSSRPNQGSIKTEQAVELEITSFPEGFDPKATKLTHYATTV